MSSLRTRIGAGKRRHYATVQKAVVTTDALGGRKATSWSDLSGKWWVSIDESPSFNNEKNAAQTYVIEGKYRADVVENHAAKVMQRVVAGGKTMKVVLVQNPQQRNIDLLLHCVDAN